MNAQTWLFIAVVCFSVSFVLLVAAVFIFLKMKIPSVIDDLSGKKVAREIREMREKNETDKSKSDTEPKPSRTAYSHPSKQLSADTAGELKGREKPLSSGEPTDGGFKTTVLFTAEDSGSTAVLDEKDVGGTAVLSEEAVGGTAVLCENETGGTAILSDEETGGTAVLSDEEIGGTAVLSENETGDTAILSENGIGGTTVLSSDKNGEADGSETAELYEASGKPVPFKVTRSIVEIHTDERIG